MAPSREDTTTTMTHMSPNSCCISGAGYWSVFSQYHRLIINCSSLLIRKPIVFSTGELLPEFLQFKRWRKVKLERRSTSVELLCPSTVGVTSRQLFNDGLPVWGPLYCYLRPSLSAESPLYRECGGSFIWYRVTLWIWHNFMKLSRSESNFAFESKKNWNLRYLRAEDLEAALLGDDGVQ